jgi:hypothetical protein
VRIHRVVAVAGFVSVAAAWPAGAFAQATGTAPVRTATAIQVEEAPRLDGDLSDPVWALAPEASEFLQKEPDEGAPATEDTSLRIVFDGNNLYIGIHCRDAEPDKIIASEQGRDRDLTKDDHVSLLLDTFHDHRNAFQLTTNPLGARYDARITEEGRNVDLNWDDKWDVAARVTADGWVAEIQVPFKTLRTAGGENQTWGLDVQRMVRRKNELSYFQNYRRNFTFLDVSQAGHLGGLTRIPDGLTWRLKPYGLVGMEARTQGPNRRDNKSTLGLDGKWRVSSGLTLDFTLNPDFAQAEVDDQIVNLTRFPLFFPEKREFFRESAGIFEFGTALGLTATAGRELIGFFSRRIGLASTGEAVPITAGGRLTGRVSGFEIGVLNMYTDDFRSDVRPEVRLPETNYTVARVKRDVLARSNVGALFTHRATGDRDDANTMLGLDANLVFFENLRVRSFLTRTDTPRLERLATAANPLAPRRLDEWAGRFALQWTTDALQAEAEYLDIGTDYNPELGFVPRRDMRKSSAGIGWKPRPESGWVRQYTFRTRVEYTSNQAGRMEDRIVHLPTVDVLFHSGDFLTFDFHDNFLLLPNPFAIVPGRFTVPPGGYDGHDFLFIYNASPARRVWGTPLVRYRRWWGQYGGDTRQWEFRPQVRITQEVSLGLTYFLDDVWNLPLVGTSDRGSFTAHVVNGRVDVSPTNRLLSTLMFQYNSLDRLQIVQLRINRILRLSDNFFVSFNQTKQLGTGRVDRSILAKLSYSLDF